MSLGRQRERQADMARSPGHMFYDKLQAVQRLIAADLDAFVETRCAKDMRRVAAGRRCRQVATSACC